MASVSADTNITSWRLFGSTAQFERFSEYQLIGSDKWGWNFGDDLQ